MRVTYVARAFLDYRVPVFSQLSELCGGTFSLIYSADYVPQVSQDRAREILGTAARGLSGEIGIGLQKNEGYANRKIRVSVQRRLFSEIRTTRPAVLVGDGFFQWTAYALIYTALYRVPLTVCYERWAHTERNAQWFRKLYRKLAIRYVGAMCCNGRLSAEYSQNLGISEDRITMGNMVADTDGIRRQVEAIKSDDRESLRGTLHASGLTFLVVSRLIRPKGIREFLQGWAEFSANATAPTSLLVVGGGPEEENLRTACQALGLESVRIVGAVPYADVPRYYAAADVLAMPTLEDNWSLVVPEAMACGLPILCSRYNGCYPELVAEGLNGWVYDPLEPLDLVEKLGRFAEADRRGELPFFGFQSRQILEAHTPRSAAAAIHEACRIAVRGGKFETAAATTPGRSRADLRRTG